MKQKKYERTIASFEKKPRSFQFSSKQIDRKNSTFQQFISSASFKNQNFRCYLVSEPYSIFPILFTKFALTQDPKVIQSKSDTPTKLSVQHSVLTNNNIRKYQFF